jgi:Zn-finger nucleic acid-binding protein
MSQRSNEAGLERCPVCGAPVARGARSCDYCAAPLASLRCAGCYASNSADALHCAGCGERLGLEPIPSDPVELSCPECRRPFQAFGGRGGRLGDCADCSGQFVEHGLLRELIERREVHRPVLGRAPAPANPLSKPVRYLKCPSCAAMMNRQNFGGTSGIVVDVCTLHGVWFEEGELPRVLAFVQAGGLERARKREELTQAQRERNRRLDAAAAPPLSRRGDHDDYEWASVLADGLFELLDVSVKALKKRF